MRVIKDRQLLVFQLDDNSTVKYNLQTRETIGKLGKPVKDLRTQLRGYSMSELLDSFEDKNYANFLRYVWNRHTELSNIGSVLEKAKFLSSMEQVFSAGIKRVNYRRRRNTPCFSYGDISHILRIVVIGNF